MSSSRRLHGGLGWQIHLEAMSFPKPAPSGAPQRGNETTESSGEPDFHLFTRGLRGLFFGDEGLRAFWGMLLFFGIRHVLRYCVYPIALALVPSAAAGAGDILPRETYVSEGAALLCVLIATGLMALIERRPIAAYGFSPRHSLRYFGAGLATGVTLLSLLVASLRAAGLLVFDVRLLFGASMLRNGAIWLGGFLLVGLAEELLSRGYLQFTLSRCLTPIYRWLIGARRPEALGFWTAALILSFAFGYGHRMNSGESPLGLFSAGLGGFLFCLSLWRTGSLWWAIGFHASWDWAQSFLYGVADSGLIVHGRLYATHAVGRPWLSGGLTGPEGSLLFLPVALAGAAVILLTLPRMHFGYRLADAADTYPH
jgi:membrane protease YdiL (CAAX protease family)